MEEEFYGIVKLISGEEIFSKISVCEEETETILLLDNPVTLEMIVIRQMGITTLKIDPWIKFADDSMSIIKMESVITVSEIKDVNLITAYEKYIREKNKKSGRSKLTPNMGFVSNISDARKTLEKIYKDG